MLPYNNTYITISETDPNIISLFTSCSSIQYLNKFIVNKHATIQQYLHYNIWDWSPHSLPLYKLF